MAIKSTNTVVCYWVIVQRRFYSMDYSVSHFLNKTVSPLKLIFLTLHGTECLTTWELSFRAKLPDNHEIISVWTQTSSGPSGRADNCMAEKWKHQILSCSEAFNVRPDEYWAKMADTIETGQSKWTNEALYHRMPETVHPKNKILSFSEHPCLLVSQMAVLGAEKQPVTFNICHSFRSPEYACEHTTRTQWTWEEKHKQYQDFWPHCANKYFE